MNDDITYVGMDAHKNSIVAAALLRPCSPFLGPDRLSFMQMFDRTPKSGTVMGVGLDVQCPALSKCDIGFNIQVHPTVLGHAVHYPKT